MKPRLCVVVTSEMTVRAFLRPHLLALQEHYDLTLVVNTGDEQLLEHLGVIGRLRPMAIGRTISVLNDITAFWSLARYLRSERFDLVHSMTPKAGLLAMTAARVTGVPIRLHTFTGQVWATRTGLSRSFLKFMDVLIARCATFTLADSASQRDLLVAERVVAADRIDVLGHGSVSGVDPVRFRPDLVRRRHVRDRLGIAEDALVILYAGRLTKDKGVLDLAHAFAALAAERPDVQLLLLGPDEQEMRPALRQICRDCEPRVHFLDFIEEPGEVMAAADMLSLPSYREGFGSVVIEAAAVGIPAVASRISGVVDAVEDGRTGLLHEAGAVAELTTHLRTLAADPVLRLTLGDAARNRALADFPPAILTSALLDLYRDLRDGSAPRSGWYRGVGKRVLDVSLAGAALVLLAPLGALLALAIFVSLGSPVFFRQVRPGRHGRLFELVKFRTMAEHRDANGQALPDGERLTGLGRWLRSVSLDELPELWNVLVGDMSLVGPRPLLVEYLERYTSRQARRHDVRPGITGLAQVSGRNAISWERKFELDLEYLERCSLTLDLKILALTIWQVVTRRGVNQPGHATAEEFMGTVGR